MATSTSNLGLTLPSLNDAADIAVLNNNFQKIDGKIPAAGAAPAGYGLGTSGAQCDDCNNAIVDGFYSLSGGSLKNGPPADTYFWFGSMFVVSRHGQMIEQMAFYENRIAVRANLDGVWTEWEYLNPRMILGIEYRTTERWNGSPVYAKAVSCGKGPSGGAVNLPTGLSGNETFVEANCKAVSDAGWGMFLNQYLSFGEKGSGAATISISGAGDLSTRNIYLTMKYIKE